jgi:hypothetical protein
MGESSQQLHSNVRFTPLTETAWYKSVLTHCGIPLDTRHTYTKSDWLIRIAAIVTDTNLRDSLISAVMRYAADGESNQPFGDWYDTAGGAVLSQTRCRRSPGFNEPFSAINVSLY